MEERNRPGVYVRSIAEYERIYGRGPALAPLFVAYGIEEPKRWYKRILDRLRRRRPQLVVTRVKEPGGE
jgi:hypothetical protein